MNNISLWLDTQIVNLTTLEIFVIKSISPNGITIKISDPLAQFFSNGLKKIKIYNASGTNFRLSLAV